MNDERCPKCADVLESFGISGNDLYCPACGWGIPEQIKGKEWISPEAIEAMIAEIEAACSPSKTEEAGAKVRWLISELRKAREQLRIARDWIKERAADDMTALTCRCDCPIEAEEVLKRMEAAK